MFSSSVIHFSLLGNRLKVKEESSISVFTSATMQQNLFRLLSLVGLFSASVTAAPPSEYSHFSHKDTINVDVCIIGGGATGTYAAIRLKEDYGKSVVVVEKAPYENAVTRPTGSVCDVTLRYASNTFVVTPPSGSLSRHGQACQQSIAGGKHRPPSSHAVG